MNTFQEFGALPIASKNEMSPRGISINFDEFGKPLKDLIKSHEKDEVPKILRDIINYIKYFGKPQYIIILQLT